MNAHAQSISYEQSTKLKYAEIAKRLGKIPVKAKKPVVHTIVNKTATLTYSVTVAKEKYPRDRSAIPSWKTHQRQIDYHVVQWRLLLASPPAADISDYIKARCGELQVSYNLLMSDSKTKGIAPYRQRLMFEIRHKYGLSYPRIGRIFGRDSTTAMHGVKMAEANPELGTVPYQSKPLFTPICNSLREEIDALWKLGWRQVDISKELGIGRRTLSKYIQRRGWVHHNNPMKKGKPSA